MVNALVFQRQTGPMKPGALTLVPARRNSRQVRLTVSSATSQYGLEASTNLLQWPRLVTTNAPDGLQVFDDLAAANDGHRFYRAVLTP
jgi:hypothetical protein